MTSSSFGINIFAATSGGLLQISEDGDPVRHFTVLDGLPKSDLTCLAVFGDRLFIGTKSNGIVTFDGEHFAKYTWPDRRQQAEIDELKVIVWGLTHKALLCRSRN